MVWYGMVWYNMVWYDTAHIPPDLTLHWLDRVGAGLGQGWDIGTEMGQ